MEPAGTNPVDAGAAQFTRADKLVIAACPISMLIVQMDWFALNFAMATAPRLDQ